MTPSHSTKNGTKRYRYYVCVNAQKRGAAVCPSRSVPAAQVEQVVVAQVRRACQDPALLPATIAQARRQDDARLAELEAERRALDKDLARWHAEVRKLAWPAGPPDPDDPAAARLADLHERIRLAEGRVLRVREEAAATRRRRLGDEEVAQALAAFDPVWEALTPAEQARLVALLVERVDYDGARGKVAITFRPTGPQALTAEGTGPGGKERSA